jgi:hypothetical protein
MKFIITEQQLKFLLNRIVENEESWRETSVMSSTKERPDFDFSEEKFKTKSIRFKCKYFFNNVTTDELINRGITDEILNNFDKFICYLLYVGKDYGFGSIARQKGLNLETLSNYIDSIEISPNIKFFLLRIGKLIKDNGYTDRTVLSKIFDITLSLMAKPSEDVENIIETSISIMNNEKFTKTRQKDLFEFIKNTDISSLGFEEFLKQFFERIRPSALYEKSFEKEEHFVLSQTSPQVTVELVNSISTEYGVKIKKEVFDNMGSDLSKVLYLIDSISDCKNCEGVNAENLIKDTLSKLNFKIEGDGQEKRDLIAVKDFIFSTYDNKLNKSIEEILIKKGQGVEVKYKPREESSYLSEFFKVDSTPTNTNAINLALSKIKNFNGNYKFFMEHLVDRLFEAATKSTIKNDILKNLSGIIFNQNTFVQKKNIKFYWCKKGYANKSRLAVCYDAKGSLPFFFEKLKDDVFSKITGNISNKPFMVK